MFFNPKRSFTRLLFVTALLSHEGSAQRCVNSLAEIFLAEEPLVTDAQTAAIRTYTLCPETTFQPGQVDQTTGEISGGDFPLVCRRNCHIKCGESGSSENNCIIRGDAGATYGIFMIPYLVFGDAPQRAENIRVQGVTVQNFGVAGQIPTLAAAPGGDITFTDCAWKNNNADPLFVIDEFLLGSAGTGRRRGLAFKGASFKKYPTEENQLGHRLSDRSEEERAGVAVRKKGHAKKSRRLAGSSEFSVKFEECLFENNAPVNDPKTQGGLSLVRIRAADPENAFDQIGHMDATFIRNTFTNNQFDRNDPSAFRTIIDFYSEGKLTLEKNCFVDSPVNSQFGPVTVQAAAEVTNSDNFITQPTECGLVAKLDADYELMATADCGAMAAAEAATCQADVVAGGGFCFPGLATVQVEGRGDVTMKDIKLGDRVLVDGTDKYEPVYSFGHYAPNVKTDYLQLVLTGTTTAALELSKEHMVFLKGDRIVPASLVQVGDELVVVAADGRSHGTVTNIRVVHKKGIYAPFTASGTVVVNGIKASTFVAFQESGTLHVAGFDTGLTFQFLSRTFESPYRLWCQYGSSSCMEEETYTADGIATRVVIPHKAVRWFTEELQNDFLSIAIAIPVIAIIGLLANPIMSLLLLLVFAARFSLKCKKKI